MEKDRRSAWQLTSTMMVWLAVLLAGLVLVGEAILAGMWLLWGDDSSMGLLVGLGADAAALHAADLRGCPGDGDAAGPAGNSPSRP